MRGLGSLGAALALTAALAPARAHGQAGAAPSAGAPVTNSVGMSLVRVPAGSFTMGSPPGAPLRQDEETTRRVTLTKPIRISATEVTQQQWAAVMGTPAPAGAAAGLPATSVSWNDAQSFCRKLSQKEAVTYRLPTEAEWEHACRAGADAAATLADAPVDRDATAWHAGNSDGEPHPAGTKKPNAWGLFDVLGNVAEWTQDRYAPYPRADEADPTGPAVGATRVVRGGSFRSFAPALRCAARTGVGAAYQLPHVGFRVVRVEP